MRILERFKAAAGRVTGRGAGGRGATERNVGGRAAGKPPREPRGRPGGTGTGTGDDERNVGG
jgi:hypothetical protein